MAIVEARSWEEFLSPDCEIPHDVHFLTRREGEGDEKLIGAHKVLLADVSPVFREIFLKETREVIEVNDTTHEAFNTMIRYIYKPPGSAFFPAVHQDGEEKLNQNAIDCPLKFFDLLYLAEKYNLKSLQWDLTSQVVDIVITENNVILATTVAKKYQGMLPFDEISTEMLAKCLKFLLYCPLNGEKKSMFAITLFAITFCSLALTLRRWMMPSSSLSNPTPVAHLKAQPLLTLSG